MLGTGKNTDIRDLGCTALEDMTVKMEVIIREWVNGAGLCKRRASTPGAQTV